MKFLKYFSVFVYLKAHEGDHDEHGNPEMADKCNAEMLETGMCRGMFPQWTFDIKSGLCEFVTYGGCGGSINMFDSEEECYAGCAEFGAEKPKKSNKKN